MLGIDAGFAHMGFALWSPASKNFLEAGIVSTSKNPDRLVCEDNAVRCAFLSDKLAAIIKEHGVRLVVAEMPHGGAKSAKAAVCMAMAFAIVVSVCRTLGVELYPVRPGQIKKLAAPGQRKVSKTAVQEYIIARHGDDLLPDNARREHAADAMAAIEVWRNR